MKLTYCKHCGWLHAKGCQQKQKLKPTKPTGKAWKPTGVNTIFAEIKRLARRVELECELGVTESDEGMAMRRIKRLLNMHEQMIDILSSNWH